MGKVRRQGMSEKKNEREMHTLTLSHPKKARGGKEIEYKR
jgi:hypothetical protein